MTYPLPPTNDINPPIYYSEKFPIYVFPKYPLYVFSILYENALRCPGIMHLTGNLPEYRVKMP